MEGCFWVRAFFVSIGSNEVFCVTARRASMIKSIWKRVLHDPMRDEIALWCSGMQYAVNDLHYFIHFKTFQTMLS